MLRFSAAPLQIFCAALTNIGKVRERNEDKFLVGGRLMVVADGMGGHTGGEEAAITTVEAFGNEKPYMAQPWSHELQIEVALQQAVYLADRQVWLSGQSKDQINKPGATVVAAACLLEWVHVVHLGDSRAYLFRDEQLIQITHDHSWVNEAVREGSMTLDAIEASPRINEVDRWVGMGLESMWKVPHLAFHRKSGDVLLLCSDGLTDMVDDEAIEVILKKHLDPCNPNGACQILIDAANYGGGHDNITVGLMCFV